MFFKGEKVSLRAMEPEDLEVLYTMENNPETWDVSNFSVPYSRFFLRQYINNSQSDMYADQQLRLMVVRSEDNLVVGTVDITDFSPMHRRGELGIAIQKAHQGRGYAKEAIRLVCDYAFRFLTMHQLTAHVATDNEVSLALFKTCGFVECGKLKEWWSVGGKYKDVCLLQRLEA